MDRSPRLGAQWKMDEVGWDSFDAHALSPSLVWIVRATCLVESRADLYTAYLESVLVGSARGDAVPTIVTWGSQEAQHGEVLRRWLRLADPAFCFEQQDERYRSHVRYYDDDGRSVRGSLGNELLCRCVVESLASAYYRAIRDATAEPLLKEICDRLARDEARHFKMFYRLLQQARGREPRHLLADLRTVYGRIKDLENDQIAFAFFSSEERSSGETYSTRDAALHFLPAIYGLYEVEHVRYAARLILQALGLSLPRWMVSTVARAGFGYTRVRSAWMRLRSW